MQSLQSLRTLCSLREHGFVQDAENKECADNLCSLREPGFV
ncbi:MAG: hypothetical protein ACSW8A_09905 [Lachnospiraceae bacterium]